MWWIFILAWGNSNYFLPTAIFVAKLQLFHAFLINWNNIRSLSPNIITACNRFQSITIRRNVWQRKLAKMYYIKSTINVYLYSQHRTRFANYLYQQYIVNHGYERKYASFEYVLQQNTKFNIFALYLPKTLLTQNKSAVGFRFGQSNSLKTIWGADRWFKYKLVLKAAFAAR